VSVQPVGKDILWQHRISWLNDRQLVKVKITCVKSVFCQWYIAAVNSLLQNNRSMHVIIQLGVLSELCCCKTT